MALPLTAEQAVWLDRQAARLGSGRQSGVFDIKTRDKAVNPCLQIFGAGPAGARCKGLHLDLKIWVGPMEEDEE